MTTMTNPTTVTMQPCPAGCSRELKDHDVAVESDGRVVLEHEVSFGTHMWGTAQDNLLTGERETSVLFGDLDDGTRFAPKTPEDLREFAAQVLKAAEWIEAQA